MTPGQSLLDEAVALLRQFAGPDACTLSTYEYQRVTAFLAKVDAAPAPGTAPDLNLLRALTGEGGRRTGVLRRAGYLTWQVTEAGYRALGMEPPRAEVPAKGVLEVGTNERGEVVINHPDLEPDENGVGHIVFSPQQARALAERLLFHAGQAAPPRAEVPERDPPTKYCPHALPRSAPCRQCAYVRLGGRFRLKGAAE